MGDRGDRFFPAMPKIRLGEIVDEYLRLQTAPAGKTGQEEMGRIIGTRRQGVNSIINRGRGRRFTFDHLAKFAEAKGIPTSQLLRDLAMLAWQRENELLGIAGGTSSAALPTLLLSAPADDERGSLTLDELISGLERLIREHRGKGSK